MATTATEPTRRTAHTEVRPGDRALQWGALFFAAGAVWHNYDHVHRGAGTISAQLRTIGIAGSVLTAIVVVLMLVRHPRAPQAALIGGLVLGLGFIGAHWLPTWSVFSDSFVDGHVSAVTKAASLTEIAGAFVAAGTGYFVLRLRRS
ncbi:MAG TPA: hypothetical protein VF660_08635 [Actinomycetota bacterium]